MRQKEPLMPLDVLEAVAVAHDPDEMLTPAETSKLTKLTIRTLSDKRWNGSGPPFHKLGKGRCAPVRYRRRDVVEWMAGDS
jgi:hypothetical protein